MLYFIFQIFNLYLFKRLQMQLKHSLTLVFESLIYLQYFCLYFPALHRFLEFNDFGNSK